MWWDTWESTDDGQISPVCPSHFLFGTGLSELQGTTELSHVISVIAMWRGNPTLSLETKENYSSYQNVNLFYLAIASLFWFHASLCFHKSFHFSFTDLLLRVVLLCSALSFISSLSVFTHPMPCSVIKTNASGHYTFLTCDSHLLYTYKVLQTIVLRFMSRSHCGGNARCLSLSV